jgi:putative peptidoglycan lipid II flippase
MKKIAAILMAITVISKLSGLARDLTLSYIYGASNTSDAYLISMTSPSVIFGFIATGIAAGFIPMYSKILQENGELEANRFTNNLINILFLLCTIVIALGLIFTDQVVRVFASGFNEETLKLTIQFTKITLIAIYFTSAVSIFSGFLQLKDNYIAPALVTIPMNIIIIMSLIISAYTNVVILAIGFVVAIFSQVLLMIPYLKRNRYKYKAIFELKDKNIKKLAYIVMPLVLGVSVNEINVLVDRTLASQLAVGGISALNYADRLNGFVQGIFVISIATVLYPMMSRMAAEKNIEGLKIALAEAVTGINLLVIPATTGFMMLATPIISALFERGAFDDNALQMTSYALFYFSIGMVGFGLRDVFSRAFYSMQDTKTPMINAAIGVILNIILNIILSKYMGIGGLALATSISAIFTTLLLIISLRKKIGPFGLKHISVSFIKILFASLLMGIAAKISFTYFEEIIGSNVALLIAILTGVVSYALIISFMKIDDVELFVKYLKKKLNKE